MTITEVSRDVPVGYVPGAVRFSYRARERRTETYRTWLAKGELPWCVECLLCGQWDASHATRAGAVAWGASGHPGWCHVVQGCHCPQPHITAAMGARLGLGADYPRRLALPLFRLAGGRRKYCGPSLDRHGTPHGAPEGTYYYWR